MVVTWGAARVPCSRFKVMMKRNLDGDRAFSGDSIINEPPPTRYDVASGQRLSIPLTLRAGNQTVTLSLAAGNMVPADTGASDTRSLSFFVNCVNLRTSENP